ncbi:MAG: carbamate kinase [Anaerolineae bacterium]|nr:carbamate kinase [Anaerolineae bacterium]
MVGKLAVVAVGGNSLIRDPRKPDIDSQWGAVHETCRNIAAMIAAGWSVTITHGNGPQVGTNMRRFEIAQQHGLYEVPLDLLVAHTQASIGYMLQQALDSALRRHGINRTIVTVVTQTTVDASDRAFTNPDKPVGAFMDEEEARQREAEGWTVREDAGRGWRRVVPSPQPMALQETNAIRMLVINDYIVIAAGGGGVPVMRDAQGDLRGVRAVIDKDRGGSLLARELRADLLIISTGVEKVALNFNRPDQRDLDVLSVAEAERYREEGHFAPGSMLPKIDACLDFVRNGGPEAIVTNPPNLTRALRGETGTRILPAPLPA